MKQLINLLIILASVIIGVGGLVSLGWHIFGYHNYVAAIGAALIIIPAVPTLVKWFKDAQKGGL